MSNRVTIQRTAFVNVRGNISTTYGYRMYDDCSQTYDNALDANQVELTDVELLRYIHNTGDVVAEAMFDTIRESGVIIDGDFQTPEWVEKALET